MNVVWQLVCLLVCKQWQRVPDADIAVALNTDWAMMVVRAYTHMCGMCLLMLCAALVCVLHTGASCVSAGHHPAWCVPHAASGDSVDVWGRRRWAQHKRALEGSAWPAE